jgi:murein DD-endopeptidase MepM/ murein hydrolase activator NlpD
LKCLLLAGALFFQACASTGHRPGAGGPEEVPSPAASLIDFGWPTQIPVVIDYFGWRSKKRVHEGLDLAARTGTPILAAEKGKVLYVGSRLKGYGLLIVIDHGDDWSSSYAHLSRAHVRRGDWVKKGEQIALSGRSGRVTGPHLHFEIRKGSDPLDPLLFMPQDYSAR